MRFLSTAPDRPGGALDGVARPVRVPETTTVARVLAATMLRVPDEPDRRRDVAGLDRLVTVVAHLVPQPSRPLSWLLAIPRWLE